MKTILKTAVFKIGMDLIEELEVTLELILSIKCDHELSIEYKPAKITDIISDEDYLAAFPHILGKPWTPRGTCVKLADDSKLCVYNGVIIFIKESEFNMQRIAKDHYEYICDDRGFLFHTTDPNNMLIRMTRKNVSTKFGEFNIYQKNLASTRLIIIYNDNTYIDKDTCYNYDGVAYPEGQYNGVVINHAPPGYHNYKKDPLPTISTYHGDEKLQPITLIETDYPELINNNIPMIKNLQDLYDYMDPLWERYFF